MFLECIRSYSDGGVIRVAVPAVKTIFRSLEQGGCLWRGRNTAEPQNSTNIMRSMKL